MPFIGSSLFSPSCAKTYQPIAVARSSRSINARIYINIMRISNIQIHPDISIADCKREYGSTSKRKNANENRERKKPKQ